MFSAPARQVAYHILAIVDEAADLRDARVHNTELPTWEQGRIRRLIRSLDTAVQLNATALPAEAFLTAMALTIKIFLQMVLRETTKTCQNAIEIKGEEDNEGEVNDSGTAIQLMEVLQRPEQQLCSSLGLCASLESVFWQNMMGAMVACDCETRSFYISRLSLITDALELRSWHEATIILQRFFWVPTIFSGPGYQILSGMLFS